MKIAIPVEDYETEICPSFGRAPMFLIYDTETKEKKLLDNSGIAVQGGAGIKSGTGCGGRTGRGFISAPLR